MKRLWMRLVALVAMVCLLGGSLACGSALANGGWGFARVNNPNPEDRLNLRAAPNNDAASLGLYYNGARVDVITKVDAVWWQVDCYGRQGYMQGKYLMLEEYHMDQLPQSAMPIGKISGPNVGNVNMRVLPKDGAQVARKVASGRAVEIMGVCEEGKWLHVFAKPTSADSEGCTGYILAQYVDVPGGLRPVASATKKTSGSKDSYALINNPNVEDRLNLRVSPASDAVSLGRYYNGVEVKVLEKTNTQWWKIDVYGRVGYVQAQFLMQNYSPSPAFSAFAVKFGSVIDGITADRINLRAQPDEKSTQLAKVYSGTLVTVLGVCEGGKWLHVLVNDPNDANASLAGFVMTKYISVPDGIRPL